MTRANPNSAAAVDLINRSPLGALRAQAVRLLLCAAMAGCLTYAALSLLPVRYTSEARLAITPNASEALEAHARALRSSDLVLSAAGRLKLYERAEFNGSPTGFAALLARVGLGKAPEGDLEQRVSNAVMSRLQTGALRDGTGVGVRFTSTDATLSAAMANALAESYRTHVRASVTSLPVQDRNDGASPRVETLRAELGAAEALLAQAKTELDQAKADAAQAVGPAQPRVVDTAKVAALAEARKWADIAKRDAEGQLQAVRDAIRSNLADTLPVVQQSASLQVLIQQRVTLERQISEAAATLLPAHPRMRQLQADLAGLKQQIQSELGKIVQALDKDAKAAAAKADVAARELAAAQGVPQPVAAQAAGAPIADIEARLRTAQASVEEKRAALSALVASTGDTSARGEPVSVEIVSRAQPAPVGQGPRKGSMATLMFAGVLLAGMLLVVVREMTRRAPAPSPSASTQPKTTVVAKSKASKAASGGLRALAGLLPELLATKPQRGGRRTLVTAANAEMDGGAEALEIARASAAAGESVLLMQWDVSGRACAPGGVAASDQGINDVLAGGVLFDEVIRPLDAGVHLLPAGQRPGSLAATLDPDMLNMAFDALDETYDHFIVFGCRADVTKLFKAIEGRFDTAVEVFDAVPDTLPAATEVLGFEVQGIQVLRCLKGDVAPQAMTAGVSPAAIERALKPATRKRGAA